MIFPSFRTGVDLDAGPLTSSGSRGGGEGRGLLEFAGDRLSGTPVLFSDLEEESGGEVYEGLY
jgi:hypothetical protein